MTDDREDASPAIPATARFEIDKLPRCKRCNLRYTLNKSTSALKLTYCSFLCELGDLGFSMAGLESMVKAPAVTTSAESAPPETIAIQ